MEKEFVLYEQALDLKELGFDEFCICSRYGSGDNKGKLYMSGPQEEEDVFAPLYQQAFRWIREKHKLHAHIFGNAEIVEETIVYNGKYKTTITTTGDFVNRPFSKKKINNGFKEWSIKPQNTYEKAKLICLKKLIDIVEERENEKRICNI